jgi:hypothetical protein
VDPGFPFVLTLVGAVSLLLLYLNRRARGAESDSPSTAPRPERKNPSRLYELARAAADHYQASASPDDLMGHPAFVEGMHHLRDGLYSDSDLVGYLTGDNAVVACMAMEALARRRGDDSVVEPILAGFNEVVPWTRYFALRALDLRAPPESPFLGRVLTRIVASWSFPAHLRFLREFVNAPRDFARLSLVDKRRIEHMRFEFRHGTR